MERKRKNLLKRMTAWFMIFAFVLGQANLPGWLHINLGTIMAHAEDNTFTYDMPVNDINYPDGTIKNTVSTTFTILNDNTVGLTSVNNSQYIQCSNAYLRIPKTVSYGKKEYTVTQIAGLGGNANLLAVSIPSTVTKIEPNTFVNASNLSLVDIPKDSSLTTIGASAFSTCFNSSQDSATLTKEQITSNANNFYSDNITFDNVNTISLPKTFQNLGSKAFSSAAELTAFTIDSSATGVKIEDSAFEQCSALKNVSLPDSTKSIGESCFDKCSKLESIAIPKDLTVISKKTFTRCSKLKSFTLKKDCSLTKINEKAFASCPLESIDLSNAEKLTEIGISAFEGCSALGDPSLPNSVTDIDDSAFSGCNSLFGTKDNDGVTHPGMFSVPKSLLHIGASAFNGCGMLWTVEWNDANVGTIGKNAFAGCTQLQYLLIPPTLSDKAIPEGLCTGCTNLYRLDIPTNITAIYKDAFNNASGLYKIQYLDTTKITYTNNQYTDYFSKTTTIIQKEDGTISTSSSDYTNETNVSKSEIKTIEASAFAGTSLESGFTIPPKVTTLTSNTFNGCSKLTNITIPNSITGIEDGVFSNCSSLKSIELSKNITHLGTSNFSGCSKLEKAVLNYTKQADLPDSTFDGCSELKEVTLPEQVTELKDSAFNNCSNLNNVSWSAITSKTATSIGNYCFNMCKNFYGFNCSQSNGKYTNQDLSLNFPSLITIGSYAFLGNEKISKVLLKGSGIESIPNGCFAKTNIKTISLPSTLTSLENGSFILSKSNSAKDIYKSLTAETSLDSITFSNDKLPKDFIKKNAFSDRDYSLDKSDPSDKKAITSSTKFHIPKNYKSQYVDYFNTTLGIYIPEENFSGDQTSISSTNYTITTLSDGAKETSIPVKGQIKVHVTPILDDDSIEYISSNNNIATVNNEGVVTAGDTTGTVKISARINNVKDTDNSVKISIIKYNSVNDKDKLNKMVTATFDNSATVYTIGDFSASDKYFSNGDSKEIKLSDNITNQNIDTNKLTDFIYCSDLTCTGSKSEVSTDNVSSLDKAPGSDPSKTMKTIKNSYIQIDYNNSVAKVKVLKNPDKQLTFTATFNSFYTDTNPCTLTINVEPIYTDVKVTKPSYTMTLATGQFDATKSTYFTFTPGYKSGTYEQISFFSTNPAVATVDENGYVTAVGPGNTNIIATGSKSNVTQQFALTVLNPIASIETNDKQTTYTAIAGQQLNIPYKSNNEVPTKNGNDTLKWESSATTVATVTDTNNSLSVSTLKAGSTTLTATNSLGKKVGSISIKATDIKLDTSSATIFTKGPNKSTKIKLNDTSVPSGTPVSYSVTGKSAKYVKVSQSGVVTAKKATTSKSGAAKVTVKAYNSTATFNVTVTKAVLTVSIDGTTYKKKKKTYYISKKTKKTTVSVDQNYSGDKKVKFKYSSSKKSVAKISKKGVIKLRKKGTTKIKVTCNGISKTLKLKVTK